MKSIYFFYFTKSLQIEVQLSYILIMPFFLEILVFEPHTRRSAHSEWLSVAMNGLSHPFRKGVVNLSVAMNRLCHLLGKGSVSKQSTARGASLGQDKVPEKSEVSPTQLASSPLWQADEVSAKEKEKDNWFNIDRSSHFQNFLLHLVVTYCPRIC